MAAALFPLIERGGQVRVQGGGVLPVDLAEVGAGRLGVAALGGGADVLGLVAGGAERDHARERLDPGAVVVAPQLVAFDGVLGAAAAADLAAIARLPIAVAAQAVPVLGRQF